MDKAPDQQVMNDAYDHALWLRRCQSPLEQRDRMLCDLGHYVSQLLAALEKGQENCDAVYDDLKAENARLMERKDWWQKNAEGIAKERADAWTALLAVDPFMREEMPDGPDGQRGCATPEYRSAYRLVLAALKDREALLALMKPATVA